MATRSKPVAPKRVSWQELLQNLILALAPVAIEAAVSRLQPADSGEILDVDPATVKPLPAPKKK